MPDREKVIERLEECLSASCRGFRTCPYGDADWDAVREALSLLKEHEKPDCEHAEHDSAGCLGYAVCMQDDEPIDVCKTCREYTGNRYEEVKRDAAD